MACYNGGSLLDRGVCSSQLANANGDQQVQFVTRKPQSRSQALVAQHVCMQEDAHVAVLNLDGRSDSAFFGIFDGHGGAQVAKFCAKHMPDLFLSSEEYKNGDIEKALVSAYLGIDDKLRDPANAEELNRMKAKSSANSNGTGLEAVDQQESVGSGTPPWVNLCHSMQR